MDSRSAKARRLLLEGAMAFVLIVWVSISTAFCLALVRAATRRNVPNANSNECPIPSTAGVPRLHSRAALDRNATVPLATV